MDLEYEFSELSPLQALASWGLPGEIVHRHENGVVCIHCPKLPRVAIYAPNVIDSPMYLNVMEHICAWVPDEQDAGRVPVILWRRIGQGFSARNRRVILWTLRYPNRSLWMPTATSLQYGPTRYAAWIFAISCRACTPSP